MSSVAKLKDRARALEQRERWREALQLYREAAERAGAEEVDLALWNRIGDLHLRLGEVDRAVDAYDRAATAYGEAGLHNNAIALCRKILRVAPGRADTYLRLGRLSADKGFFADARQNFLEYAERMQKAGRIDDSFAALKEFADLFPEDVEVRRLLADRLRSHGRSAEALEWAPSRGEEVDLQEGAAEESTAADAVWTLSPVPLDGLETSGGFGYGEVEPDLRFEDEDEFEPLPLMELEPEAEEPPVDSLADLDRRVSALRERGLDAEADAVLREADRDLAARGEFREAAGVVRALLGLHPDEISLYQKQVEYAVRSRDRETLIEAYLELGRYLQRSGNPDRARVVWGRVLEVDPGNAEARAALPPGGEGAKPF